MTHDDYEDMVDSTGVLEPTEEDMLEATKSFVQATGGYTNALAYLIECADMEAHGDWSSGYTTRRFAVAAMRAMQTAHQALSKKKAEGLEKTASMMAVPWLGRGGGPR